ncbi:LysR family transcriptional regulator [Pseudoduganella sp. FT26W]|uniref:LysR family transcriptional regulator n=1 Tax=Duganella aquatilis TaxID=2666082 RepID=A0A844DCN2_9BURK|nr:LysR family transcriptional regulator [Duganella aquatilis]MRW86206.1 LysR family transcriptional regulator [Duganella aquatilis]
MSQPNWDDLRFFLALHDAGTLSGAARAAGVEHTTVARRIDALEEKLAVKLFDRFPKGWSLTAAGKALVPHARKMEESLHGLMREASGTTALSGKVRVSAPPAVTAWVLAPRLPPALHRLPGIELDLRAELRVTDLMRRESDIALRYTRPTAPGLAVRSVATVTYRLCATEAYLASRAPEQWEFLGYDELLQHAPQHQWLEKIRGMRRCYMRANDLGTLYQATLAGSGVAVLPDYFPLAGLVEIEASLCPIKRKLWIVMHEDVRRAAPVRAVADEIIALFTSVG